MQFVPRWISIIARPLRRSSVIDERVHSFRRRRAEKDLSQETLLTGVVTKIVKTLHSANDEIALFGLFCKATEP